MRRMRSRFLYNTSKKHTYLYLLCFMALFCSLPLPRGIPLDVITHFMRPSVTKQRKMKQQKQIFLIHIFREGFILVSLQFSHMWRLFHIISRHKEQDLQNWTHANIFSFTQNGKKTTINKTFTTVIELDLTDSNIDRYYAYSPLIELSPAWKIFYKVYTGFILSY